MVTQLHPADARLHGLDDVLGALGIGKSIRDEEQAW
jgi:hypothetical protein